MSELWDILRSAVLELLYFQKWYKYASWSGTNLQNKITTLSTNLGTLHGCVERTAMMEAFPDLKAIWRSSWRETEKYNTEEVNKIGELLLTHRVEVSVTWANKRTPFLWPSPVVSCKHAWLFSQSRLLQCPFHHHPQILPLTFSLYWVTYDWPVQRADSE